MTEDESEEGFRAGLAQDRREQKEAQALAARLRPVQEAAAAAKVVDLLDKVYRFLLEHESPLAEEVHQLGCEFAVSADGWRTYAKAAEIQEQRIFGGQAD